MTVLNPLLLLSALLTLFPRASAELVQGPTGVEHAKRFTPSPCAGGGSRTYTCPTYTPPESCLHWGSCHSRPSGKHAVL